MPDAQKPPAGWPGADPQDYLDADHLVPTPYAVGQRGVIDLQLARERLKRKGGGQRALLQPGAVCAAAKRYFFSAPRLFAEHCCSLGELCMAEPLLEFKVRFICCGTTAPTTA